MNKKIIITLIICLYVAVFFYYIDKIGITWDEPDYINSSQTQFKFIKNYSTLTRAKKYSIIGNAIPQHPSLVRWVHGIIYKFVKIYKVKFLNFRLGNLIFLAVFLIGTSLLILNLFDYNVLIIYLLLNLLNPKFTFYMVIGSMDFPILSFIILISAYYFKKFKKYKTVILFIIFVCLGYAIKLNSVYIVCICLLSSLIFNRYKLKYIIISICIMIISLYLFYPLLWLNPIRNYKAYLLFHLTHFQNYTYYFSKIFNPYTSPVPWHYPLVYFLFAFTEITVIFSLAGTLYFIKKFSREKYFFILAAAWSPIILLSKPNTPCYNGIRIFFSSLPFLNIIAAIFIVKVYKNIVLLRNKKIFVSVMILFFIYTLFCYFNISPCPGSYYNNFILGTKNAANVGLQIDMWGENFNSEIINFVNQKLEKNSKIYLVGHHPDTPRYLQKIGLLKPSFRFNHEVFPDDLTSFNYGIILNNKSLWNESVFKIINEKKSILFTLNKNDVDLAYVIKFNHK